jgi:hypothetical protein
MVRPERFELPTLWFEAKCSIQLSYGRTLKQGSLSLKVNDILAMRQLIPARNPVKPQKRKNPRQSCPFVLPVSYTPTAILDKENKRIPGIFRGSSFKP